MNGAAGKSHRRGQAKRAGTMAFTKVLAHRAGLPKTPPASSMSSRLGPNSTAPTPAQAVSTS